MCQFAVSVHIELLCANIQLPTVYMTLLDPDMLSPFIYLHPCLGLTFSLPPFLYPPPYLPLSFLSLLHPFLPPSTPSFPPSLLPSFFLPPSLPPSLPSSHEIGVVAASSLRWLVDDLCFPAPTLRKSSCYNGRYIHNM